MFGLSGFGKRFFSRDSRVSSQRVSHSYKDIVYLKSLAREMHRIDLTRYGSQDLSNTLFLLAKSDFKDVHILESISKTILQRHLSEFTTQDLSRILWGYATLDFKKKDVLQGLAHEICSRNEESNFCLAEWAPILWSFACLEYLHEEPVRKLFDFKFASKPLDTIEKKPIQAKQLFQCNLAWTQTFGENVPSVLLESLNSDKWVEEMLPKEENPSASLALLLKPYFDPEDFLLEATVCGGIPVDLLVPSKKVVVEVDGPDHYFLESKLLNGHILFKRRLLERAGFKLCSIPVMDYEKKTKERRAQYIQSLVAGIKK